MSGPEFEQAKPLQIEAMNIGAKLQCLYQCVRSWDEQAEKRYEELQQVVEKDAFEGDEKRWKQDDMYFARGQALAFAEVCEKIGELFDDILEYRTK